MSNYQPFTCWTCKSCTYLFEDIYIDENQKLYVKKGDDKYKPLKEYEFIDKKYFYVPDINKNRIRVIF